MIGKASELVVKIIIGKNDELLSKDVNQYLCSLGDKGVISIDTEIALGVSTSASNGYGGSDLTWNQIKCTLVHKK